MFHGIFQPGLYNKLVTGTRPPLPPGAYPKKLVALVKDCWHGRPRSRPGFLQICNKLEEVRYDLLMEIPSATNQGTLRQFSIHSSTDTNYIKVTFRNCSDSRNSWTNMLRWLTNFEILQLIMFAVSFLGPHELRSFILWLPKDHWWSRDMLIN